MHVFYTPQFKRALSEFDKIVERKLAKKLRFLIANIKHPSLRAKKYNEATGLWQARVDRQIRFYFRIRGDTYVMYDIYRHED